MLEKHKPEIRVVIICMNTYISELNKAIERSYLKKNFLRGKKYGEVKKYRGKTRITRDKHRKI